METPVGSDQADVRINWQLAFDGRPGLARGQPIGVAETGRYGWPRRSISGDAYSEAKQAVWRPLALGTFYTDGWREPFINPPAGSGGAPRSGWGNSFEGTFFRAWFYPRPTQASRIRNVGWTSTSMPAMRPTAR